MKNFEIEEVDGIHRIKIDGELTDFGYKPSKFNVENMKDFAPLKIRPAHITALLVPEITDMIVLAVMTKYTLLDDEETTLRNLIETAIFGK